MLLLQICINLILILRLGWMHAFDAACYLEPRILEYDAGECPLPVSKFGASRAEAITDVQTLDKANRLYLADCS